MMTNMLASFAEKLPDRYYLPVRSAYHVMTNSFDKEIVRAGALLKRHRRFLDVGANTGIYSYYFMRRMQYVEAFEPLAEVTKKLAALSSSSVNIHNLALSDINSILEFHIPVDAGGALRTTRASIEPRDGPSVVRKVEVKQLDEFGFEDVDMIKIDVEGHETQVIRGAAETIRKCRPIMVVEIEQRHVSQPVSEIFREIESYGYSGFFFDKGTLKNVDAFDVDAHQTCFLDDVYQRGYVNNFIFVAR
ncbi:FkbM family methyltransferase [Hyphomonas sp. GM-8P]|uniref:FkbM family methyltransferase n=1 Tax=Hyphomonas sp. GM-8P TaxID=1280945 RepID=UPI000DC01423|nr:FkbM family methyltransferase [Hyphomonas sp. GM-8P]RAN39216.1 hypothetical protein HY26_16705 [Hyphomonas sp. GM-8P]